MSATNPRRSSRIQKQNNKPHYDTPTIEADTDIPFEPENKHMLVLWFDASGAQMGNWWFVEILKQSAQHNNDKIRDLLLYHDNDDTITFNHQKSLCWKVCDNPCVLF